MTLLLRHSSTFLALPPFRPLPLLRRLNLPVLTCAISQLLTMHTLLIRILYTLRPTTCLLI
jgi:hypothetical protein